MKNMRMYLLVFAFIAVLNSVNAQTFWQDDFENATTPDITNGSTRTASNNGGTGGPPNTSYFKRTNGSDISVATTSFSNFSNTFFWAGEDHDTPFGASAAEQQIEWTGINISGKSSITFSGLFGANSTNGSWDNFTTGSGASGYGIFAYPSASNDYIMVEYAVDAGAYIKLISFFSDDITGPIGSAKKLKEDTDGNFIGDGTALNQAMAEFTKSITVSGSTMKIRIRVYSNGGNEEWAIDNFRLSSLITSSTWNGSIWSNGLPTSSIDAIIASSTPPTSFTCKTLTINSSVSLSTTGITATVNGNIINNGNGISGTGTLVVNASSTLSGNAISFNGVLNVNTGATLSTSGLLTITSNSTTTGSVGTSAGSITGNVTVQRYIPGGRRAFRFISHPFSSSLSLSSLTDNIDITGTGGSPLTSTLSNAPSAYSYDNSIGNSSLSNDPGWLALSSSGVFNSKTGYRILIRGSKGQTGSLTGGTYTPDPVTLDWTGTLNQGNQIVTLTNNGTNRDYTLIGNPYASPVNLSLTSRGSSINANFSVWNPNLLSKGGYETQAFSSSYILPSGAAFFAQTTSNSNNTITFTESSKSTSTASAIFRNSSTEEMLHLELLDSKGNYADKLIFYINPNNKQYTAQNDALWDAVKLINPEVNIYSFSKDQIQLSVDRRSSLEESVQLGFTGNQGEYSIVIKELPINASLNYYLKDNYLQKQTLLQKGESISVSIDVEPASQGKERFEIVSQPKSKYTTSSKIEINLSPNPAKGIVTLAYTQTSELNTKVTILDALGKKVQTINLGKVQSGTRKIDISHLSSGVYFVQYENGEEARTEKLIIK